MAKSGKKKEMVQGILDMFERISAIPRPSKKEEQICNWLMDWSREHNFPARKDAVGNIVIQVPGTKGYEKSKPVIIQGHVDMVCEKEKDSNHDFSKDPIKFVYDGEWLKAHKTTLGADNGIAVAMALVLATEPGFAHPPLELLFTVDEETGLTGAISLENDVLQGRILINLDSEDEGVFTIGCAGGRETDVSLPLVYDEVPDGYRAFSLVVENLSGGHSGVNIHLGRAHALKLLSRVLGAIKDCGELRILYFGGGTAHNVIPRSSEAKFYISEHAAEKAAEIVRECEAVFRKEFKACDPELRVVLESLGNLPDRRAMTLDSGNRLLDLIAAFPHGVAAMSHDVEGLVETSNNLASAKIEGGELHLVSSQRSSVMSRLTAITKRVEAVARLAGAKYTSNTGYPGWQPNVESKLLDLFKATYKKMFKKEAKVEAIHAGLECGLIGAKYPGMDMISIGATLKDPHSPSERLHIPSIEKVWDLLIKVLGELK